MLFTEHQFAQLKPYMDTVVANVYDREALDIAIPLCASELIGSHLAERVQARYQGRSSSVKGGASAFISPANPEDLDILVTGLPYTVHYGVVITDRVLTQSFSGVCTRDVSFVLFDWWQWANRHIPQARLVDAWMYLCVACPTYRDSVACQTIGFDQDVLVAMQEEGQKLFQAMEDEVSHALLSLWSEPERLDFEQREK